MSRRRARIPVAAAACLLAVCCRAAVDRMLAPEYVYFSSKGRASDRAWAKKMMESPAYRLDSSRRDEIVAHRSGSSRGALHGDRPRVGGGRPASIA